MSATLPSKARGTEHIPADASFATTLAKGLAVLEAFAPDRPRLGNSEIAARTGLSRPTVARLTHTLAELGYLAYDSERAKYRLWARALTTAHPLLVNMKVRQIGRPLMQELANSVRGAVSIGFLDGLDVVYVESARAGEIAAHIPDIGSSVPVLRAAMGRAALSLLDVADTRAIEARFATALPDMWQEYADATRRGAQQCRERGFCVSHGDWVKELHAVAAPLYRDPNFGNACFAMNCGVPAFRLRPGELENDIGPRLTALARSVRTLCGHADRAA